MFEGVAAPTVCQMSRILWFVVPFCWFHEHTAKFKAGRCHRNLARIGSTLRPWRATRSSCCWALWLAWLSTMVRDTSAASELPWNMRHSHMRRSQGHCCPFGLHFNQLCRGCFLTCQPRYYIHSAGVLLDFPLPLALYKKVARQPLTLRDLEGFDPTLGRSLRQLLDYSGAD
jgi:hypothetical protein